MEHGLQIRPTQKTHILEKRIESTYQMSKASYQMLSQTAKSSIISGTLLISLGIGLVITKIFQ